MKTVPKIAWQLKRNPGWVNPVIPAERPELSNKKSSSLELLLKLVGGLKKGQDSYKQGSSPGVISAKGIQVCLVLLCLPNGKA